MIRDLCVQLKWLVVIMVFLAGLAADRTAAAAVETYVDQATGPAVPADMGQPLSAGELTLRDVLKTPSAKNKGPTNLLADQPAPAATPQLKPLTQDSSAGTMLLQGLQSALRQSGANTTTPLKSTYLPRDRAAADAAASSSTGAPQLTAKGVTVSTLPDVQSAAAAVMGDAPVAAASAATSSGAPCTPQVSSWTKSCAEAGYPSNYTGEIHGETRSTCPQGNLQDVWISNGCAPPEGSTSAAAASPAGALTSPVEQSANVSQAPVGDAPMDASCGVSNGLAANARPLYDLCAAGTASAVSGEGPWRWNCKGFNGGMSVSCAAPVAAAGLANAGNNASPQNSAPATAGFEDALCGAANGVVADQAPYNGLCAKGAASRVNGDGPWTWACSGVNGGRAAACSAPKKTDGVCGLANSSGADQMPMSDLCVSGYASAVTGSGPWNWTCSGLNGGQAATCSAAPKLNAVCGPASLTGSLDAPRNGLCSVGQAGIVNGHGPWSWVCSGLNGGASVSCDAPVSVSGACGLAHGASLADAPVDGLCSSGKASRVGGNGPWNWTCTGTDGGDTASCTAVRSNERKPVPVAAVAPKASSSKAAAPVAAASASDDTSLCGSAAELVAIEAPSMNLCKSGTASAVSGKSPWNWSCSDDHGHQSSCATLSLAVSNGDDAPAAAAPAVAAVPAESQAAACGNAAGQGTVEEPANDLCAAGKASSVKGQGPWTWSCVKGKSRAACTAPKLAQGACGPANGSMQKSAPTSQLCASGTPTQVQGTGPWLWSCVGAGGGASASCSAASQSQTRVEGNCGAAANAQLSATPAANLCDSGVASTVYGEGPWTWTCSGMNGGAAASCSAQKNTPPPPPPPGPPLNGLCGSANGVAMVVQPMDNLCATGTATSVSGNGPWNWNCIGENSGMTVSCTAPLQPPAPISGVCGAANGVPTLTTPRSGLCSAGISSAVSGKGPWTWSCSGVNGGSAVGCVAPLAGNDVGSLPSMTTQAPFGDEAPAPQASPSGAVTKKGLVTPRLSTSDALPPMQTGNLPPAPKASQMAMMPSVPFEAPQLPEDTQGVTPPPVRDMIQPAPALKGDDSAAVLPGNHFVLDGDVSTIPFTHGSENYDPAVLPTLQKLANILNQNGGVRITLTAYADAAGSTPREARRLSLSRALAIRDFLTSKNISSARIDVRALGANVSSGEADRVDVKAN